jgi:2-dehydro-3-deoxyphosphogluconate aldolase/(4S)-4-hydroxy-2-oxoglutarate aldolase
MLDPTALVSTPVIPVLTIERAADAVPLARALVAGGLPVIEVTLRTRLRSRRSRRLPHKCPTVLSASAR